MELQRREQESAAQVQQQNEQMQQRLDQNYAAYAPQGGSGGGGGGVAAPERQTPATPAKNPLLGRWQQIAGKPFDLGVLGSTKGTRTPTRMSMA